LSKRQQYRIKVVSDEFLLFLLSVSTYEFIQTHCLSVHFSANKMNTVKLELPPDEAGDVLTVKHLAKEVCIETGVDLWNQILTFKG